MGKSQTKLAIFDTFKTKENSLTGEAIRQRSIIRILSSKANPAERTRTGISQKIAKINLFSLQCLGTHYDSQSHVLRKRALLSIPGQL